MRSFHLLVLVTLWSYCLSEWPALIVRTATASPVESPGVFSDSTKPQSTRNPPLPPNILLILTDDQDTWASDVYLTMPRTKTWIQDAGVRFTRAFANTPVCCPSRATLLTGRLPHSPGMTMCVIIYIFWLIAYALHLHLKLQSS